MHNWVYIKHSSTLWEFCRDKARKPSKRSRDGWNFKDGVKHDRRGIESLEVLPRPNCSRRVGPTHFRRLVSRSFLGRDIQPLFLVRPGDHKDLSGPKYSRFRLSVLDKPLIPKQLALNQYRELVRRGLGTGGEEQHKSTPRRISPDSACALAVPLDLPEELKTSFRLRSQLPRANKATHAAKLKAVFNDSR